MLLRNINKLLVDNCKRASGEMASWLYLSVSKPPLRAAQVVSPSPCFVYKGKYSLSTRSRQVMLYCGCSTCVQVNPLIILPSQIWPKEMLTNQWSDQPQLFRHPASICDFFRCPLTRTPIECLSRVYQVVECPDRLLHGGHSVRSMRIHYIDICQPQPLQTRIHALNYVLPREASVVLPPPGSTI